MQTIFPALTLKSDLLNEMKFDMQKMLHQREVIIYENYIHNLVLYVGNRL